MRQELGDFADQRRRISTRPCSGYKCGGGQPGKGAPRGRSKDSTSPLRVKNATTPVKGTIITGGGRAKSIYR